MQAAANSIVDKSMVTQPERNPNPLEVATKVYDAVSLEIEISSSRPRTGDSSLARRQVKINEIRQIEGQDIANQHTIDELNQNHTPAGRPKSAIRHPSKPRPKSSPGTVNKVTIKSVDGVTVNNISSPKVPRQMSASSMKHRKFSVTHDKIISFMPNTDGHKTGVDSSKQMDKPQENQEKGTIDLMRRIMEHL